MDDPESQTLSKNRNGIIGIMFLSAWHLFTLPFMIRAIFSGSGGNICGPSDELMIILSVGFIDLLLFIFSGVIALAKKKLLYKPFLINLGVAILTVLCSILAG